MAVEEEDGRSQRRRRGGGGGGSGEVVMDGVVWGTRVKRDRG